MSASSLNLSPADDGRPVHEVVTDLLRGVTAAPSRKIARAKTARLIEPYANRAKLPAGHDELLATLEGAIKIGGGYRKFSEEQQRVLRRARRWIPHQKQIAKDKAADKTHAGSGGKTKGVIAIEEAAIVSVINGYGPGTPKASSLLVGWATLLVPQGGDGYPAVELDEPGIMADAFKAAGERLKGFLHGKQAEIVEDSIDYFETLAAGKVNEPVGEPFSAENPMPMTRAAIRGVTVNDPARTREFQVGGGDPAAARRTLDEGECLETSPQRAAETH